MCLLAEDLKATTKKFEAEAAFADWIARSAADPEKSKVYERLAAHFRELAHATASG